MPAPKLEPREAGLSTDLQSYIMLVQMRRRIALMLLAARVLAGEDTWNQVERIVAVGDVHGGYQAFVDVLRNAKLIDDQEQWIGGKAHLVQTGDVPDRGPGTRKALDLLMSLEKQAAKAGGYVHALIGNHEAMNMYGDLRYVTPAEFAAFRSNQSQALLAARWEMETKKKRPKPDGIAKAKWMTEHPEGWVEHHDQFAPQGKYGKWIRGHNTVVKINGVLFLHGGISPKYADKSLREMNDGVRDELSNFSLLKEDGYVRDPDGPLWYRGIAKADSGLAEHVAAVLKRHGARRIVIGHTSTPGKIVPLFDGTVITIDAGLSDVYGGYRMCLILEGEEAFVLNNTQKTALTW